MVIALQEKLIVLHQGKWQSVGLSLAKDLLSVSRHLKIAQFSFFSFTTSFGEVIISGNANCWASLYEIGYCLIGADIFSKNIVKYPPFFPRDEEASNKLVASQPSSGQGESLGSWSKLTSLDNMDVRLLTPGKVEVGKVVTVLYEDKEYKCKVVEVKQGKVKVHYVGYSAGYDEWLSSIWAEALRSPQVL